MHVSVCVKKVPLDRTQLFTDELCWSTINIASPEQTSIYYFEATNYSVIFHLIVTFNWFNILKKKQKFENLQYYAEPKFEIFLLLILRTFRTAEPYLLCVQWVELKCKPLSRIIEWKCIFANLLIRTIQLPNVIAIWFLIRTSHGLLKHRYLWGHHLRLFCFRFLR